MARITSYIPEPKEEYDVENQRQILRAVDTIKQVAQQIYSLVVEQVQSFLEN